MSELEHRLRHDLTEAMRAQHRDVARVLRTLLAAIANAEAQPDEDGTPVSLRGDGPIAGAATGLGSSDVARRELSDDDVLAIVRTELDERLAALDQLTAAGATDAAAGLRAEVALLEEYLV
jgi:uncharacterized protein